MRTCGWWLIVGLLAVALSGCSEGRRTQNSLKRIDSAATTGAAGSDASPHPESGSAPSATGEGMVGGMPAMGGRAGKMGPAMGGMRSGSAPPPGTPTTAEEPPAAVPAAAAAMAGAERPRTRQNAPPSGILTAGSFDDNLEPRFFQAFLRKFSQSQFAGDLPTRLQGQRLMLLVRNSAGAPVGNARVQIAAGGGGPGVELTTRSDGRVVFLASWDPVPGDGPYTVTVTPGDGSPPVTEAVPRNVPRWEITLPAAKAELPVNLDLAIVLDTTGSMGDEVSYLKSEIRSIAAAVKDKFPQVNQQFALVLYRDEGDEYVTRTFDFTPSIEAFQKNLAAQRAAGGGDEPEAMHKALEDSLQLRWRGGNTARVLFLITDAPPHQQHLGRTMAAADRLRRDGTAIYPVACSGYKDDAELVLRSLALLSGSQFLFLTDDSGVGNPHAEPHIPFYHVEKLAPLMVRMIAGELSGKRVEAEKGQIIRTVGKPIN
jgi:von Willebrand factor type A domain